MKLSELEPQFVIHTLQGETKIDVHTDDINLATGITFLCPVCWVKNSGPIGTHGIIVTFSGKGVPDELGSHNYEGKPSRWDMSGTRYNDLTLKPSIDITRNSPGEWHGFITNGEVTNA